jgi:hypothetical protein
MPQSVRAFLYFKVRICSRRGWLRLFLKDSSSLFGFGVMKQLWEFVSGDAFDAQEDALFRRKLADSG